MRRVVVLCAIIAVGLTACTESPQPGPEVAIAAAAMPGTCDLTQAIAGNVRSWFMQPERRDEQEVARALGRACADGDQSQTTIVAWQLLGDMETAFANDRGGAALVGETLANQLLACTVSLCLATALPSYDLANALGNAAGLFVIRSEGTTPAFSKGAVPFIDTGGQPNGATWIVEVTDDWANVLDAQAIPALLWGYPTTPPGGEPEVGVAGLAYELNITPEIGRFEDGDLHISVCFDTPFEMPLTASGEPAPRMRRNRPGLSVILSNYETPLCPVAAAPQAASIAAPFMNLVSRLLPARSTAAFGFAGVIGGTPLDFSTFVPVATDTEATLQFVTVPSLDNVAVGQAIGTIEVLALSGAGTPMELVEVELFVNSLQGTPANGDLFGDKVEFTGELLGQAGIASFSGPLSFGKPGGYRVCAHGTLPGFTFNEPCLDIINVQQN